MEAMTKKEVEQFLKDHPKPWEERFNPNYGYYAGDSINLNCYITTENLLRYIAYLEQKNEAMQGLIDIMGDGN